MRKKEIQRIFLAWLLLATFLPMLVVKSFHHHEVDHASSELALHSLSVDHPSHAGGVDCGCPICHFIISPYTEAEVHEFSIFVPYALIHRPLMDEQRKSFRLIYSHGLRAPPCHSLPKA